MLFPHVVKITTCLRSLFKKLSTDHSKDLSNVILYTKKEEDYVWAIVFILFFLEF